MSQCDLLQTLVEASLGCKQHTQPVMVVGLGGIELEGRSQFGLGIDEVPVLRIVSKTEDGMGWARTGSTRMAWRAKFCALLSD